VKRSAAIFASVSTALAVLGAGGTAGASVPNSGCPTGFELAPTSIIGPGSSGQVIDLNNDQMICVKFISNPGIPPGSFIFIDNTTP
jgi:hypothetical protein